MTLKVLNNLENLLKRFHQYGKVSLLTSNKLWCATGETKHEPIGMQMSGPFCFRFGLCLLLFLGGIYCRPAPVSGLEDNSSGGLSHEQDCKEHESRTPIKSFSYFLILCLRGHSTCNNGSLNVSSVRNDEATSYRLNQLKDIAMYYYWHGGDLQKAEKEIFKGVTLKKV